MLIHKDLKEDKRLINRLKPNLRSIISWYDKDSIPREQRLRFAIYCVSDCLKNNNAKTLEESKKILKYLKELPANENKDIILERSHEIRNFLSSYFNSIDEYRFYQEALQQNPNLDYTAYFYYSFFLEYNAYKAAYNAYDYLWNSYTDIACFTSRRGRSTLPFIMQFDYYPYCAIISSGHKIDLSEVRQDDIGNFLYDDDKVFKDNEKYLEYYNFGLSMYTKTQGFPSDDFIRDYTFTNVDELAVLLDYLEEKYPDNNLVYDGKLNLPNDYLVKADNNLELSNCIFNNKYKWILSYVKDIISGSREINNDSKSNN